MINKAVIRQTSYRSSIRLQATNIFYKPNDCSSHRARIIELSEKISNLSLSGYICSVENIESGKKKETRGKR